MSTRRLFIATLIAVTLVCCNPPPSGAEPLFKIWKDGAWGFINRRGEVIIQPKYLRVTGMNGDAHLAQLPDKKWVLVSASCEKQLYDKPTVWMKHLGDGLYTVRQANDDDIIFDPTGKFKMPKGMTFEGGEFRDGRIPVCQDYRFGYADSHGKVVISTQFDDADTFSEGLASVRQDGKTRYINVEGRTVIDSREIELVGPFEHGLARQFENGRVYFINPDGKLAFSQTFAMASKFSEGLAAAQIDDGGPYGYIDRSGKFVIEPQFFFASEFHEGLAPVRVSSEFHHGFIDMSGRLVISYEPAHGQEDWVQGLDYFRDGLAWVSLTINPRAMPLTTDIAQHSYAWWKGFYIDRSGKVIWRSAEK